MVQKNHRSFLKWAGGKYLLLNKIRQNLPSGHRLIEPFAGSGTVFLNTDYSNYLLADVNEDLIRCFHYLQNEKQSFIDFCKQFFQGQYNNKASFHSLRTEFNTTKDPRLKSGLFIYLNRHCFNGLMRYNQSGLFNTSFGDYKKPYFPEQEMRLFASKSSNARISCLDYVQSMEQAVPGDVIYCDPPYVPLSATSNFTTYHTGGFGPTDQENLEYMARLLAKKGIPVLISNHDVEYVQNLYATAHLIRFKVQRSISCNGDMRNKVPELLALFS